MRRCDNNASASNLNIKTANINEEYNKDQQKNQETFSNTNPKTSTNATFCKNDETLNITKPFENPISKVFDDVTTIKTTIDNAKNLEKAAKAATATSNTMLPQPADVAATAMKTVEKKTGNVLKIEVAAAKVVVVPSLAASVAEAKTATTVSAEKPLIPAATVSSAASATASVVSFESATTTATLLDDNNATVAGRATAAIEGDQIKSTATKLAALLTLDYRGQPTIATTTSDISANHAPATITTLPSAATLATLTTKPQTAPASPTTTPMAASVTHLPHIASEPTFGIILRRNQQQQQQRFRSYHDAKLEGTASTSSTDEYPMTSSSGSGSGSSVIIRPGVSVSASASPSMVRKSSDSCMSMSRRVSFPKSDNELVTGYLEPANPWEHACLVKSISEIAELYVMSCQKHKTKPLQTILDHLKAVELNKTLRQPLLSLKTIKLAPSDCEALEEVFKRVQYKAVDLSSCELSETAAMALFEMIEYYEAANELDISSNADGMTHRGWTSCTYMISHSRALQMLNAQGNPISRTGAENLGHALNTSNLHTIKLEHCGLKGAPLYGLCFKLRHNRVLRELWLAHNDLDWYDAENIAKLITANHYLQLLDISNNNIRDEGLKYIVRALITQSREIEKRSLFQRAPAIDDDDCGGVEITSGIAENVSISCNTTNGKHKQQDDSIRGSGLMDSDASQSEDTDDEAFESDRNTTSTNESKTLLATTKIFEGIETVCSRSATNATTLTTTTASTTTTAAETATSEDLEVDEEDTEETMKSTPSATVKNSTQSAGNGGGQSMLDKLLSMNSTDSSSSEDAASNLSTDTLAACNSEDASLISDDIFDGGAATATTTTNTSTNALTRVVPAPLTTSSTNDTITSNAKTTELERVSVAGEATLPEATNGERSNTESNNSGNSSATSSTSNNGNNNNNINAMHQMDDADDVVLKAPACIFELTAEENYCLISSSATKALDVNKNTTKLVDDFDDTHSTDSAFESASEGDISRHLPEEFTRLSASFESSRIDEAIAASKEFSGVETATIATESTECLVSAVAAATTGTVTSPCATPTTEPHMQLAAQARSTTSMPPTPTLLAAALVVDAVSPVVIRLDELCDSTASGGVECSSSLPSVSPKVTISEDTLYLNKLKGLSCIVSPSPTPPPPSTSPGGASLGMRRTESSCAFITSSTRNRSQSSDSLCSDTSLDGSLNSDINFSTSTQINEKLAKNDTLTRQQRQFEVPVENSTKAPCGLKALALWNNNLTKDTGLYIAELLAETSSMELLNIGKNCLSNDFVSTIKDSLMRNTTLTTLGLQSAHLSAKGIETLSSILTFGGNCTLQRIDIRDNKLEVESLSTIAEVLKSNTTVTQIDIDDEPKRLSVGNDAHLDYARVLENVRSMCSRNEKTQSQLQAADKSVALANVAGRRRGGYYLGSRKISLTCHTRPIVSPDNANTVTAVAAHNSKLDVKRKTGTRLRSPIPSPPTVSPSSSPSRSRFKVFRVSEVSPLTSPMSTAPSTTSCSVTIPTASASNHQQKLQSTSLPTTSSLSVMASVTSSTQSIKRYSASPRSRFQVSKIYEDPRVPLANRALPPITPPLNAPPTPMIKSAGGTVLSYSPPVQCVAEIVAEATAESPSTGNTSPSANTTVIATTELSHTPNLDSTKATTTTINTTNTNYTQKTTTLSPISSASSSSSSSSSTSPASLSSTSSIISATSSSSTSSSITPLFSDSDDVDKAPAPTVTGARCPIAVFDENDITLTKNSTNNVRLTTMDSANSSVDATDSGTVTVQQQPTQPRARKTSWLGNPAAVDKLLTLFHNPGTIFQRSSSPDSNLTTATAATTSTTPLEAYQLPTEQQKSLVPSRKCSPPAWSKLGNEMMRPVTSALQSTNSGDVNSTATSLANTAEQSISFLDAASKQICDFSKQVFRQNLAFGNETNAVVGAAGSSASGVISMLPNNGSTGLGSIEQHDAAHIPSNVQLEIKENISPEHTITDEAFHSLQKLCLTAGGGGGIVAAASAITFEEQAVFLPDHITEETNEQAVSSKSNILLPTANVSSTSTGSSLQQQEEQKQQQHATPQTS